MRLNSKAIIADRENYFIGYFRDNDNSPVEERPITDDLAPDLSNLFDWLVDTLYDNIYKSGIFYLALGRWYMGDEWYNVDIEETPLENWCWRVISNYDPDKGSHLNYLAACLAKEAEKQLRFPRILFDNVYFEPLRYTTEFHIGCGVASKYAVHPLTSGEELATHFGTLFQPHLLTLIFLKEWSLYTCAWRGDIKNCFKGRYDWFDYASQLPNNKAWWKWFCLKYFKQEIDINEL